MRELFIDGLAKSAPLARVADATHTRKSMPPIYRTPAPKARHPNQLDLFAEASINPATPGAYPDAPALPMEDSDAANHPLTPRNSQPLVEVPAADGRGTHPDRPALEGIEERREEDGGSAPRIRLHPENAISGSVGIGHRRMADAADPSPPAGIIVSDPDPEPTLFPSRDFRIDESHRIGEGSLHQKARDNIAAIGTLKKLEGENRDATDAEKAVLARYAGWGAMSGAFDWHPSQEWKQTAKELKELAEPMRNTNRRAPRLPMRTSPRLS